jgi:hypothetical protein
MMLTGDETLKKPVVYAPPETNLQADLNHYFGLRKSNPVFEEDEDFCMKIAEDNNFLN